MQIQSISTPAVLASCERAVVTVAEKALYHRDHGTSQTPRLDLCITQVFQRQMSKEGLQAVVNGNDAAGGGWSSEMLRDLFTLRQDTASDTYDSRCRPDDDDSMEIGDGRTQALAPPEHKLQVTHQCRADGLHFPCSGRYCLLS